jgi:hypothetical protein
MISTKFKNYFKYDNDGKNKQNLLLEGISREGKRKYHEN